MRSALGLLDDSWQFNGVSWTQLPYGPGTRTGTHMAFDPLRQHTVLYGGEGQHWPPDLDDTWEWDGVSWILASMCSNQIDTGGKPVPMVFDPALGKIVLVDPYGAFAWDGAYWTPAFCISSGMNASGVYDATRQRILSWCGSTRLLTATPATATIRPQSCGNSPDLRLFGRAALGTASDVHLEGTPRRPAFVVYGLQLQLQTLASGCDRMVSIDALHFGVLDGSGRLDQALAVPLVPALRGFAYHAQAIVLDGGPVQGASLSGALTLAVGD